jgi:hypothetical protein
MAPLIELLSNNLSCSIASLVIYSAILFCVQSLCTISGIPENMPAEEKMSGSK